MLKRFSLFFKSLLIFATRFVATTRILDKPGRNSSGQHPRCACNSNARDMEI